MWSGRSFQIPAAHVATLTAMLLIAQQVAGKAARDALFLSNFSPAYLPIAMGAGAAISLAAAYWVSSFMARHAPGTILPLFFGTSACGFALAWGVDLSWPRAAAVLVYLQTVLLGPVTMSTFWSLVNERFDPHTAKPLVARIAGGGTLGGVLGGLAAWRAPSLGVALLFLAALNALAVVGSLLTRRHHEVSASAPSSERLSGEGEALSPLATLRAAPFLRSLALLIALGAAMSAILDYVFGVQAAAAYGKGQPLLAFFSLFWLVVGVASFLMQMAFGRVVLEKLGLALNVATLPAIIVLGGAFGLAVPGLASVALLRGAEAVQRNTLFRSAYELFYTPVPEQHKRTTKALIDVAFDRVGTVFGSAITFVVLHAFVRDEQPLLLGAVILLGAATLPVVRRLHHGYVSALQQGLREGAKKHRLPVDDESERMSRAPQQAHRDTLIERIERIKPGGLTALMGSGSAARPDAAQAPAWALEALRQPEALVEATRDALSENAERRTRALTRLQPHSPALACAILALAHPERCEQALQALRANAESSTGQLLDALLDPAMDFVVRRRIPRALDQCATQRAVDGLLLGLSEERFEVRYACGRALLRVSEKNPQLQISSEVVFAAVQRELESGKQILQGPLAQFDDDNGDDEPGALMGGLMRDRVTRGLEHVFTILSLHLEREPLRMAFRALYHDDETYRGTALEYLDTVLPAEIRESLWPYLGAAGPLVATRAPQDLLADLSRLEAGR